jgi:hypothetical protein
MKTQTSSRIAALAFLALTPLVLAACSSADVTVPGPIPALTTPEMVAPGTTGSSDNAQDEMKVSETETVPSEAVSPNEVTPDVVLPNTDSRGVTSIDDIPSEKEQAIMDKYGPIDGNVTVQKTGVDWLLSTSGSVPTVPAAGGFTSKQVTEALKVAYVASQLAKMEQLATVNLSQTSATEIGDQAASVLRGVTTADFYRELQKSAGNVKNTYRKDSGDKQTKAFWRWMPLGMCNGVTQSQLRGSNCVTVPQMTLKNVKSWSNSEVKGIQFTVFEEYSASTWLGIYPGVPARGIMEDTAVYTMIPNPVKDSPMKWLITDVSFDQFFTNLVPVSKDKP